MALNNLFPRRTLLAAALLGGFATVAAFAQAPAERYGAVTLLDGNPRMLGESLRELQAPVVNAPIETGENDRVGVTFESAVLHVGENARFTILRDADQTTIQVESGLVVLYHDEALTQPIVIETPFGRLTPNLQDLGPDGTGVYTIRHDPAKPGVTVAVSTFSTIEGDATVEGIVPVAGPYDLPAHTLWVIREGETPGAPSPGDEAGAADALAAALHRGTLEQLRPIDLAQLPTSDSFGGPGIAPLVQLTSGQFIYQASDIVALPPVFFPLRPLEQAALDFRLTGPQLLPAGTPNAASADFVAYEGNIVNTNFNQFLTAVDGLPAFLPRYVTSLENAGLSYIQIAGPGAEVRTAADGSQFLTGGTTATGWAVFTPTTALASAGFQPNDNALAVVDSGLGAYATAAHLPTGGTIGPGAFGPENGFAIVDGTDVVLNPNGPTGYPILRQAGDTSGLEVGGVVNADQLAAIGAGRDPRELSRPAPRLTFLSDASVDANGNAVNFDGAPLAPTELNLPGSRNIATEARPGDTSRGIPLANDATNTVGLQFARTGDIVAIIHHTGVQGVTQGTFQVSDNFEVVRGPRDTVVRWRADNRPTNADGSPVEFEDLNNIAQVRTELFAVIADESNRVTPPGRQTIFGPSVIETPSMARRLGDRLRRDAGRFTSTYIRGRSLQKSSVIGQPARSAGQQTLKAGTLRRVGAPALERRFIGRRTK